jgi:hypothetical protein
VAWPGGRGKQAKEAKDSALNTVHRGICAMHRARAFSVAGLFLDLDPALDLDQFF